jgi:hypothetical protein
MQKDFMAMAQGQQAPAAAVQTKDPKVLQNLEAPDEELYQKIGMPTGEDDATIKQRVLIMFENLGLMEGLSKDGLLELQQKIDDYIKVIKTKDMQAIENHPVSKILEKAAQELMAQQEQPTGGPVPQQAAPTDFASMMPPTPGGISNGR